jgi:hypothetical protein
MLPVDSQSQLFGSEFSWQAIGAYGFELGTYQGVTFSGVIGYRALLVDYARARVGRAMSSTCCSTAQCSESAHGCEAIRAYPSLIVIEGDW